MSDAVLIPLYLLPIGARPRQHPLIALSDIKTFRLLDCPSYGGCLNFAARANWTGFHCVRCPRFREHHQAYAERYGLLPPQFPDELVALPSKRL